MAGNEKRLIDVDKAKKDFNLHFGGVSHAVIANRILDEQPTVDAVEVVHGHWISKGYKIECSACGHRVFIGTRDPVLHTVENNIRKYCHNCGAKMDGDGNG